MTSFKYKNFTYKKGGSSVKSAKLIFLITESRYPNTCASHSKFSEIARRSEQRVFIKNEKITFNLSFLEIFGCGTKNLDILASFRCQIANN